MKPMKKIALLHDLCGIGKAALTNMMPVLSVMGIEVCPIPTMLLSTHTGGYGKPVIYSIEPSFIKECANHYMEQKIVFDMIFIGYLGKVDMVDAVTYFVKSFPNVPVILDPIMGDHGSYYQNFDATYGNAMKKLVPLADLLIPNFTEVSLLSGNSYEKFETEDLLECIYTLQELGGKNILMTSIPTKTKEKQMLLYEKHKITMFENEYLPYEYHGTGDTFDAVLIGNLLKGFSLVESINKAHNFVYTCMEESNRHTYEEREGLMIEQSLSLLI